jgi:parallel beta-helix repeat protein
MKCNSTILISILWVSLFLTVIANVNLYSINSNEIQKTNAILLNTSATYNNTIEINDFPGNLQNWTWAKDQGICTGSGTNNNPYIIRNHFFNTRGITVNSLHIRNSRKFFRVENCLFNTSLNNAGIRLWNTTNGYIVNNRNLPDTGALVWLYNSSYNTVINNNASYCHYYGILVELQSHHNTIIKNLGSYNIQSGIALYSGSSFNIVEDNTVYLNPIGIHLYTSSSNNTIKGNHIYNNTLIGLQVVPSATNNIIYLNCFINNMIHANDDGVDNIWDFGGKGNYWDNYTGIDANNDGIGDLPYNITGAAGSLDNFPLMKCPTPSSAGGIPGYELSIVIVGILISSISVIYLTFKEKKLKV